ncbi:ABC transporter permease subunit [Neobacillus sp. OS1-32]|uniref:ABC transporter permease subunit n=1 Tax=Neobacillus sp. OS1-32 TaxID=3070682 RepID=UPI0027E0F644|nr:ABC transporter permease subunit [Neobacillus sp. OS1-32]WML32509.1 ABC transporter permease subunit [Neobacillus sp. OS1-32]
MRLLTFELKKNFKRKKFILLFLVVILFLTGLAIRNLLMQDKMRENALQNIYPHHREASDLVKLYMEKLKDQPQNETLRTSYENAVEMENDISDIETAINNRDWGTIPKIEADFLRRVSTHLKLGGEYKSFQGNELEQRIKKNTILLKHHLPYEDENYSLTIPQFMKNAAVLFISVIGVFILVLITADQMSEEFDHQTIRILYTQPVKKAGILLGKYASMMALTLFMLLVFFLSSSVVPLLFGGKAGSFSYPQLVQYTNGFTYISILEYIIKLTFLFIGAASFAFSLVLLCSFLFKNRFTTFFVSVLILLCGILLTDQMEAWQRVQNPFYLFQMTELMERPKSLGIPGSILVLFAYSFAALLISYFFQGKGVIFRTGSATKRPFNKGRTLCTLSKARGILPIALFEWRKIWRQESAKQTFAVLLLLFSLGYVFLTYQTNEKKRDFVETMRTTLEGQKGEVQWLKQYLQRQQDKLNKLENKKSSLNENEKTMLAGLKSSIPQLEESMKESQLMVEKDKDVLDAYTKEDWPRFYEYWIYQNQLEKGEITGATHYQSHLSNFTYKASIAEKKFLAKHNVEPTLPPEYLYTIYDDQYFPNPLDRIEQKRSSWKLDNTGLFTVYQFFNTFIYLPLLFILVFLYGAGFAAEKGKKQTLFLLETQPLSRTQLFLAKSGVSVILSLGMALGFMLLMLFLGMAGNCFGDWQFPVLHYDTDDTAKLANYTGITAQEGSFHFIGMGQYLLECILLFLGVIIFLIAVTVLFSLFVNHVMTSMIFTLIVVLGGYFISSMPFAASISHLSPFLYLNVGKIANGELAVMLHNSSIQTWTGLLVLVISAFILFGAGLLLFQKTQMKHSHFLRGTIKIEK